MTYPTPPAQSYSYTAFQQSQGDNSFPGTQLDIDLAQLYSAVSSVTEFIKNTQRADGKLNNGLVTKDSLSSDVLIGLAPPTAWTGSTSYIAGATVSNDNKLYYCLLTHTSTASFATDLAAGDWSLIIDFTISGALGADSVATAALQDGAVTTPKLADLAVTGAKVAANTLTTGKMAVSVGFVPIGSAQNYFGLSLPTGWLWAMGQTLSRTTYQLLFDALTVSLAASGSIGSTALTIPAGYSAAGLVGSQVESSGIPAGTTVTDITGTTATLSAAIIGAITTVRLMPYGAPDTSNFYLPDAAGSVMVCRDDISGGAQGLVPSSIFTDAGKKLGSVGGSATHALTTAQLAAHAHGVTDPGHLHGVTDPGHAHNYNRPDYINSYAGGSGPASASFTTTASASAVTGVTVNTNTTGLTVNSAGSGDAHPNMQPSIICNVIVFAGV